MKDDERAYKRGDLVTPAGRLMHLVPTRLYVTDPATAAPGLFRYAEGLQLGDFCMYLCPHPTFPTMVCVLTREGRCLMTYRSRLTGLLA